MMKTVAAVSAALFASAQGAAFAKVGSFSASSCTASTLVGEEFQALDECLVMSNTDSGNVTWTSIMRTCSSNGDLTQSMYLGQTCTGTPAGNSTVSATCGAANNGFSKATCGIVSGGFVYNEYSDSGCTEGNKMFGPFTTYAPRCTRNGDFYEKLEVGDGKLTSARYNFNDCSGAVVGNMTEYTCGACTAHPTDTGKFYTLGGGCGGGLASAAWAQAPAALVAGSVLAAVIRAMAW